MCYTVKTCKADFWNLTGNILGLTNCAGIFKGLLHPKMKTQIIPNLWSVFLFFLFGTQQHTFDRVNVLFLYIEWQFMVKACSHQDECLVWEVLVTWPWCLKRCKYCFTYFLLRNNHVSEMKSWISIFIQPICNFLCNGLNRQIALKNQT